METNPTNQPQSKLQRSWKSLFTWCGARRGLISFAVCATALVVFYAEENWRGLRAWERCKRELEAKGEVLDWSAYVPAAIPAEQNIIKAPKMADWFIKPTPPNPWTNELSGKMSPNELLNAAKTNAARPIVLAHLSVVTPNSR